MKGWILYSHAANPEPEWYEITRLVDVARERQKRPLRETREPLERCWVHRP
ncbi:MAG: hypothetical protein LOD88_03110 [Novibacillus thermophilus]|jgi:hypothetical protein|uniref:hypothetical protein n=1 Tax=Novibacillus thermophilus TaxID=1471761 RepID=UPI00147324A4|nr:hypothetical protein [Novibacillus thermophilus]